MRMKLILVIMSVLLAAFAYAVPRDMCIVEIATGTWCYYCPGAAMAADELVENGQHVAVIEYHTPTESPNFVTSEASARNSYYGITGVPTAFFDGILTVGGGNHTTTMYGSYLPKVTTRLAVPSAFTLRGTASLNGNVMSVEAVANKVATNTSANVKMFIVLTESDIMISWQGQNHIDFVERAMYPGAAGTAVYLNTNPRQVVTGTINLGTSWVQNNMEAVIFLQDSVTKEIFQGTKFSFSEIPKIPTGVTILDVTGNHAQLGWTPPSLTTLGYAVYRNDEFLDFTDAVTTEYTDPNPLTGPTAYAVTALYEEGESLFSLQTIAEPVGNEDATQSIPTPSSITSIYPNPFTPESHISYQLKNTGNVSIEIFNIRGEKVRQIVNSTQTSGSYITSWDGKDENGSKLGSGVYFVRLLSNSTQDTKKIMLVK